MHIVVPVVSVHFCMYVVQVVGCSQIFLISRTGINLTIFSLVLQWQDRLIKALQSMNAGDLADQALRQIDRAQRAERDRASKDPRLVKVSDYYNQSLINNPSILSQHSSKVDSSSIG